MLLWKVIITIFSLLASVATVKILISKKISKRRSFYVFKNEEGEDIPIGI